MGQETSQVNPNDEKKITHQRIGDVIKMGVMGQLSAACARGDLEVVCNILNGPPITDRIQWDHLVTQACIGGNVEICQRMINGGGVPSTVDLKSAIRAGNVEMVKYLFHTSIRLRAPDLEDAVKHGDENKVKKLLEENKTMDTRVSLGIAALLGHIHIFQDLIAYDSKVFGRDTSNMSSPCTDIAQFKNIDEDSLSPAYRPGWGVPFSKHMLAMAVRGPNIDIVKYLKTDGQWALYNDLIISAMQAQRLVTVEYLMEHGFWHRMILPLACKFGHWSFAKKILSRNNNWLSAFHAISGRDKHQHHSLINPSHWKNEDRNDIIYTTRFILKNVPKGDETDKASDMYTQALEENVDLATFDYAKWIKDYYDVQIGFGDVAFVSQLHAQGVPLTQFTSQQQMFIIKNKQEAAIQFRKHTYDCLIKDLQGMILCFL